MDLIDEETQERLAAGDSQQRLTVAELEVGVWGVLHVAVDQIHPPRTFQRKRGGEGLVGRVTLSDATGSIDMVLWDDENALARDSLAPGNRITLRGATVKAGWKGGLELGLGSAVIEAEEPRRVTLRGTLMETGPTEPVGHPVRFKAEAVLRIDGDDVTVVCWDDAVKAVQVEPGTEVALEAEPHPALDGYFIA